MDAMSLQARKTAAEIIATSEQIAMVFTREVRSVEELRRWVALNPKSAADVDAWHKGMAEFLVVVVGKGGEPRKMVEARDWHVLQTQTLPSVGTEASGISLTLCKVQSSNTLIIGRVAQAWISMGGLSVSTAVAAKAGERG